MSNILGFQPGSSKAPSEGVGPAHNAEEDLRMGANAPSEGSEDGEIQDDQTVDTKQDSEIKIGQPVGTKRKRLPSIEEQRPSKRIDVSGVLFQNMQNPPQRIPCVIRINEREPVGSLYRTTDGFAILLFLDAGLYGPPTVSLAFRNGGTETGRDKASYNWDTTSTIRGRWAMSDIIHGYTSPEDTEPIMSNKTVLEACHDRDTRNLMYMRFDSWTQVLGSREADAFKDMSGVVQQSMNTIFKPKHSYLMEIWFIAPFEAPNFRRRCLRFFTESLAARVQPLRYFRDDNGVYFGSLPLSEPPTFLGGQAQKNPLRMPSATKKPNPIKRGAQDTVTGSDNISKQAKESRAA